MAKSKHLDEAEEVEEIIDLLRPKMEHSSQLAQAMRNLNNERKNLVAAEEIEREIVRLQERLSTKREDILSARKEFLSASEEYCSKVAEFADGFTSRLEFSVVPVWRRDDFLRAVAALFGRGKFPRFRKVTGYDLDDLKDQDYGADLLGKMWDAALDMNSPVGLPFKRGATGRECLDKVFANWYNVHYVVTSEGDQLDRMSPGKKGLVLLELIVELERRGCPILIDQPEDDLDNQSIYTELRKFIKDSKKRRKIIIVTHNANIAVGANAEEIIIANQNGAKRENKGGRQFDYCSGAIESTERPNDSPDATFLDSRSI